MAFGLGGERKVKCQSDTAWHGKEVTWEREGLCDLNLIEKQLSI